MIFQNVGLVLVLASLALACHKTNTEEDRERAISFFIMEMADDYQSYTAQNFQKIDVDFLESQMAILEQFAIVQDTTRKRLELVERMNLQLSEEMVQFKKASYRIDEVDELLMFNVQLDEMLKSTDLSLDEKLILLETQALHQLNEYLGLYNLSVFALDLSGKEKSFYYHKFKLAGEIREYIFEIEHKTENILSYKKLG